MKTNSSGSGSQGIVLRWLLIAAVLLAAPTRAESDLDPPDVVSATVSPGRVDTSDGPKEVEVVVRLRDTLSGLARIDSPFFTTLFPLRVTFRPTGINRSSQNLSISLPAVTGDNGTAVDPFDVEFRGRLTVPPGAIPGDWVLDRVGLQDLAGNALNLDALGLGSLGIAVPHFEVVGTEDALPPRIEGITCSTNRLDFAALPLNVRVLVHIRDDHAGVDPQLHSGTITYRGERTGRSTAISFGPEIGRRIEGDGLNGIYAFEVGFARNLTPPDIYRIQVVQVLDLVGNFSLLMPSEAELRGFAAAIRVEGDPGAILDFQPPDFVSLKFGTGTVDTSVGAGGVTVEIVARDDGEGPVAASLMLLGPLGLHRAQGYASTSPTDPSGPPRTMVGSINFPAHCESGEWRVQSLDLRDGSGNMRRMSGGDLEALGMPTRIVVETSPRVHVERRGGTTLVWWRRVPGIYHVQTSRHLLDWSDVSAPLFPVGSDDLVVLSADQTGSDDLFFRLIRE